MEKQRRGMWQWLADKAGAVTRLTREEWMAAYRIGAVNRVEKPYWMSQQMYREMLEAKAKIMYDYLVEGGRHMQHEQASANVQLYAPPPQSAVYEPPAPTTDKIKAAERQRLFGTQSVPAVDNHGVLRKYNEQHKAGK